MEKSRDFPCVLLCVLHIFKFLIWIWTFEFSIDEISIVNLTHFQVKTFRPMRKGGFQKIHLRAPAGEERAWHGMLWAHPVMTVTQSGLGVLVSGSSAQLPRALNRLPESLHAVLQKNSVHVWSRSLSFQWAGLWSAVKESLYDGSARKHIAKEYLIRVTCTAWRTLLWLGAFPTRVGGHHFLGATFLGS